jgi:uncharacterized protein (DUF433 family)
MPPLDSVITRDLDVLGGTPVFRGTRIAFRPLLDYLEGGQTLNEFLDDFPTVTREVAVQALDRAKSLVVDNARFVEAVNVGSKAAEHGDVVEHEEVGKKLKRILRF